MEDGTNEKCRVKAEITKDHCCNILIGSRRGTSELNLYLGVLSQRMENSPDRGDGSRDIGHILTDVHSSLENVKVLLYVDAKGIGTNPPQS